MRPPQRHFIKPLLHLLTRGRSSFEFLRLEPVIFSPLGLKRKLERKLTPPQVTVSRPALSVAYWNDVMT